MAPMKSLKKTSKRHFLSMKKLISFPFLSERVVCIVFCFKMLSLSTVTFLRWRFILKGETVEILLSDKLVCYYWLFRLFKKWIWKYRLCRKTLISTHLTFSMLLILLNISYWWGGKLHHFHLKLFTYGSNVVKKRQKNVID